MRAEKSTPQFGGNQVLNLGLGFLFKERPLLLDDFKEGVGTLLVEHLVAGHNGDQVLRRREVDDVIAFVVVVSLIITEVRGSLKPRMGSIEVYSRGHIGLISRAPRL